MVEYKGKNCIVKQIDLINCDYFDDKVIQIYSEIINMHFLQSKHVVKLFGAYISIDQVETYILMEKMENSIEQYIKQNMQKQNDEKLIKEKVSIINQIINGVFYIHESGYVHLNLNPSNIFLSSNNEIKIGDFGASYKFINPMAIKSYNSFNLIISQNSEYYPVHEYQEDFINKENDVFAIGLIIYQIIISKIEYFLQIQRMYESRVFEKYTNYFIYIITKCIERNSIRRIFALIRNLNSNFPFILEERLLPMDENLSKEIYQRLCKKYKELKKKGIRQLCLISKNPYYLFSQTLTFTNQYCKKNRKKQYDQIYFLFETEEEFKEDLQQYCKLKQMNTDFLQNDHYFNDFLTLLGGQKQKTFIWIFSQNCDSKELSSLLYQKVGQYKNLFIIPKNLKILIVYKGTKNIHNISTKLDENPIREDLLIFNNLKYGFDFLRIDEIDSNQLLPY